MCCVCSVNGTNRNLTIWPKRPYSEDHITGTDCIDVSWLDFFANLRQEDVLRLEVPVQDVLLVDEVERQDDLREQVRDLGLVQVLQVAAAEGGGGGLGLEVVVEGAAGRVLHDDHHGLVVDEVVVVLDDVRVLQHGLDLHLVDGGEAVEAAQLLHWDLTTKIYFLSINEAIFKQIYSVSFINTTQSFLCHQLPASR